jgi:hypothetical protein
MRLAAESAIRWDHVCHSGDRSLRGGAFLSPASEVRSAARFGFHPQVPLVLASLRVAWTIPPDNSSK